MGGVLFRQLDTMIRASSLRELQAKTTAALDRKAGQVASGALSPLDFMAQAKSILADSHARAAILGSNRAKRGGNIDVAIRVAAEASRSQEAFLYGFATDLANGKYRPRAQGGRGARQRLSRFALYSMRLGGTANSAWAETLLATEGNVEALWVLGRRDRHCPDCRVQAAYGWRPLQSFLFLPGEGRTKCLVLCSCKISTRSGAESYVL